jgi:hypothetical protein
VKPGVLRSVRKPKRTSSAKSLSQLVFSIFHLET